MAQPYQQQLKIRTGVYVFLKETINPVVLYFDNPQGAFEELKQAMKSATPVLVDKQANGPVKRLCVISNQIRGLALQDEQYQ
ncbi:MAG: hypothetical protein DKM23_03560 [Candidatus Melainabacteria bacterium]|nr:MAG: hypothetical protein DKM24_04095 [Candidatus Melainabacteria bacterium]RAI12594.1 MAG: hypothetical protein DKM23_03560 [Candidatus Melainabacteria bacterium]